ncbi:hypothetical protein ACFPRA_01510 [Sporosarcina soli]|uniref:YhfH-like protein n=1 Tax=Sporosarcina soli TaxID=334736 RepID=A0ABW0TGP1_9BACL
MGEFANLIQQGVYCQSCGCFTNQEPGHPIKCEGCQEKDGEEDD